MCSCPRNPRTSRQWYARLAAQLEGRLVLQLVLRRGVWPVRRGVKLVQWIEVQMGAPVFAVP